MTTFPLYDQSRQKRGKGEGEGGGVWRKVVLSGGHLFSCLLIWIWRPLFFLFFSLWILSFQFSSRHWFFSCSLRA